MLEDLKERALSSFSQLVQQGIPYTLHLVHTCQSLCCFLLHYFLKTNSSQVLHFDVLGAAQLAEVLLFFLTQQQFEFAEEPVAERDQSAGEE
jgi:hypothetical protein